MTIKFCEHGHQESTCPYCEHLAPGLDEAIQTNKNKPKMLFVDDRMRRIHYALEEYGKDYDVTFATCVPEALRALSSQNWTVVSLDHDLDGHDFQDPDTPTCGMEILRYIQKTGWPEQRHRPEFWLHSSNLFATHLMFVVLKDMNFEVWHKPIIYKIEHMKYDKDGIPL